jgi:hypothetical protein
MDIENEDASHSAQAAADTSDRTATTTTTTKANSKKGAAVSAKEYDEVCSLLCLHLKQLEESAAGAGAGVADYPGCSWQALLDWYLDHHGKDLDTGAEREQRRKLANQIIRRMVKHDGVLVVLNQAHVDSEGLGNERKMLRLSASYT